MCNQCILMIVKQLLRMRMFKLFEYLGVITTAVFVSMFAASLSKNTDYIVDPGFIVQAVASEDEITYKGGTKVDVAELECMARNIYFESNNQSKAGQVSVARVVLNRVRDQRFPNTVCDVIYEGPVAESWKTRQHADLKESQRIYYPRRNRCQFSWYCDGKADVIPKSDDNHAWRVAQDIAFDILVFNKYAGIVEGATHYHADYVNPKWSKTLTLITKIDDHIFYRWE